ncbi:MAG: SRPBCC family protein [Bacteroidales bacterium]|jgi:hypothetical protein|nr:SRPBCC family protein [Bacteroidales bacterium]
MEVKVESRIGILNQVEKCVYDFVSDCNNFKPLANHGPVKDWTSDSDSCGFSVENIGRLSFRIVDREPGKFVKFAIDNPQAENVFLWVQLKDSGLNNTRIKLTTKLNVNPMLKMLISSPLKRALDKIVDTLEHYYSH